MAEPLPPVSPPPDDPQAPPADPVGPRLPELLTLDEAAAFLRRPPGEMVDLILTGRLCGAPAGAGGSWVVGAQSVHDYLADQVETGRRMALWRQSNEASFPELWGRTA